MDAPRRSGSRRFVGLVLLLVAVIAATGCNPGRPPAATVDDTDIAAFRVDDILSGFRKGNKDLAGEIDGQGEGTYSSEWSARVLSMLIIKTLLANEADRQGLEPTEANRDAARDDLADLVSPQDPAVGARMIESIPKDTREWLVDLDAKGKALEESLVGDTEATEAVARNYYDANRDQFVRLCLLGIQVDAEDASDVKARLDDGEDFADVSAEVSTDPRLREARGSLGDCLSPGQMQQQQMSEDIFNAIMTTPYGEAAGPIEFNDGTEAVFVKVDECQPVPYEEVREQLLQQLPAEGSVAATAFVETASRKADITVDPRFGSWDAAEGVVVTPEGIEAEVAPEPRGDPCEQTGTAG